MDLLPERKKHLSETKHPNLVYLFVAKNMIVHWLMAINLSFIGHENLTTIK